MDIQGVLKELMQIAKIPQDAKVSTRTGTVTIDEWHVLQAFVRRFYGDTRTQAIEKLNTVYKTAISYCDILIEGMAINRILLRDEVTTLELEQYHSKKRDLTELHKWISESLKGLTNLEQTYNSELTDLALISDTIKTYLGVIKTKLAALEKRETQIKIIDRNRPESIKSEPHAPHTSEHKKKHKHD